MPIDVDLSVGPPLAIAAPETMRMTWRSSLRTGAGSMRSLKGLGCHPGRMHSEISLEPNAEDKRASPKRWSLSQVLKEDLAGASAKLGLVATGGLCEDGQNKQEGRRRGRRKARRKDRQLQRSESEPAMHSSRRVPAIYSPQKDGGKAAHGAARRCRSQPRQGPHHLPALQGPDQVSGGSFPRRGISDQRKKNNCSREAAEHESLMSVTLPQINASEGGSDVGNVALMAQTVCAPSRHKSKKSSQALWQIYSTAQSISEDLERTCSQLLRFEERVWASNALNSVEEEGEEADELGSLPEASGRMSASIDAASALSSPTGASVLNSQETPKDGSVALERQVSNRSRHSSKDSRRSAEDVEERALDQERLKAAFLHFVETGTYDLSISNLVELLKFLGHPVVTSTGDAVKDIAKEVTMYEYFNFDEFTFFMEKYREYEREHFREVFQNFDTDQSGELSMGELRKLIQDLGMMALTAMFKEALQVVDVDRNGQLDFAEFEKFLRIYHCNEGFTTKEVGELSTIIDQVRNSCNVGMQQAGIPVDLLSDVLVRFFGNHVNDDAKRMQQQLEERCVMTNARMSAEPVGLTLDQVLFYARLLRQIYYDDLKNEGKRQPEANASPQKSVANLSSEQQKKLREQALQRNSQVVVFRRYDTNDDNMIDEGELMKALKVMEYEPLRVVTREILDEILPEPFQAGRELDFDEFFDFLLVYRQREGFRKSEVEVLRGIFYTFDEDNSGDISTLELGDIFRYMGFSLSVDDLKRYIVLVDEDRSNTLNFREFLWLMQIHRASVVRQIREAFRSYQDKLTNKLPREDLLLALAKLGHRNIPKEIIQKIPSVAADFDDFVSLADECHEYRTNQQRKKAGFTETELDNILETFRRFDKDGSGDIDCGELQHVFTAFGWAPKNTEEQNEIWGRLDRARALAREAGVPDTTADGSASVKEWEFVQLARMIRRQQETSDERHLARLAHELRFSMPEVSEFREVFLHWLNWEQEQTDEDSGEEQGTKIEALSRETVRRVVRSMGVKLTNTSKQLLDKELEVLGKGTATLDFPSFLHLMRWFLDTDFGGICAGEKAFLK